MLLLIVVALTIVAFIRGWKWKALLPLAVSLILLVIEQVAFGTDGESVSLVDYVVYLGAIATLLYMIVKPKGKGDAQPPATDTTPPPATPQA